MGWSFKLFCLALDGPRDPTQHLIYKCPGLLDFFSFLLWKCINLYKKKEEREEGQIKKRRHRQVAPCNELEPGTKLDK